MGRPGSSSPSRLARPQAIQPTPGGAPANTVEGDDDPPPPSEAALSVAEHALDPGAGSGGGGPAYSGRREDVIDTVRIDRGMLNVSSSHAREVFGLRVSGDSMIEAGILPGDYLFVRRTASARRGDIVVALIGEEATVKYYFP